MYTKSLYTCKFFYSISGFSREEIVFSFFMQHTLEKGSKG